MGNFPANESQNTDTFRNYNPLIEQYSTVPNTKSYYITILTVTGRVLGLA